MLDFYSSIIASLTDFSWVLELQILKGGEMANTIENDEANLMACELAELTDESPNSDVLDELCERIRRIQDHYRSSPRLDQRTADEILGYGEDGIP